MAKGEKGKVRVFLFELEGSDDTLLESVRSITSSMSRAFGPSKVIVQQALPSTAQTSDSTGAVEGEDYEVDVEEPQPPTQTARPKRARRVKAPNVVTDVDLKAGPVSLEDFCNSKSPTEDSKRYLVVCAWFKEYRGMDAVGVDHVYTAYRAMKWPMPKDPSQTFRDLQRKRDWVGKGAESGTWAINHLGINEVDKLGSGVASA